MDCNDSKIKYETNKKMKTRPIGKKKIQKTN